MTHETTDALRFDQHGMQNCRDALTVEYPLQIKINGEPFSVTMRTPGADPDLVRGLLFTEAIVVADDATCAFAEERDAGSGIVATLNVTIPPVFLCPNAHAKRALLANASCGLCGQREFDGNQLETPPLPPPAPLPLAQVSALIDAMRAQQPTFAITGSTHAAALFTSDGTLLCVCEDIGRHNAVDKAIGQLLQRGALAEAQILAVSGRMSFEIISKAYRARIPFLLAVSAPSSFAVEMGKRWGMTVIGYCRDTRCTVYSHPENVTA